MSIKFWYFWWIEHFESKIHEMGKEIHEKDGIEMFKMIFWSQIKKFF